MDANRTLTNVMLVVVLVNDQVTLTQGGVMSYYEFTWPMDDRLTDEDWQEMLDNEEESPLPSWTESFVIEWDNVIVALAASPVKIREK